MSATLRAAAALALLAGLAPTAPAQDPEIPVDPTAAREVPETMTADEARVALGRAVGWIVDFQNEDGSFASATIEVGLEAGFAVETYYAWQLASTALAIRALLAVEETPERRAALDKAAAWFLETRLPKRGDHWDVDYVWSQLYATTALVELAEDPRFADAELAPRIAERGRAYLDLLARNQSYAGGWGYYDDPPYTRRPKWGTSFSTACVLPHLDRALDLGWGSDLEEGGRPMLARALTYVQRCALPNGAYAYDLRVIPRVSGESINDVKGSLSRIQVGNWARHELGDRRITDDVLREGLAAFFAEHKFLDAAFMRPRPHEAYYANAAYFYHFGHHYAAEAIELLPADERAAWHARLRPELVKTQRADGSLTDFLGSGYLKLASTAYTVLALQVGIDDVGEGEPGAIEDLLEGPGG